MRRFLAYLLSLRGVAAFTLVTFLPSAVSAWEFFPPVAAQAVFAQAEQDSRDASSVPPLVPDQSYEPPPREVMDLPEPFSLAQAQDPPPPGPELDPVAQDLLADAAALRAAGNHVDAALTYFQVMEQFPRSLEAGQTISELAVYADMARQGGFTQATLDLFEAQLPAWENCNGPESKYILLAYYASRAAGANKSDLPAVSEDYYERTIDAVLRFKDEHPNHPLQMVVQTYALSAAKALGPEVMDLIAEDLADTVRNTPLGVRRWASRAVLGEFYYEKGMKPERRLAFNTLLNEWDDAGIDAILADPTVYDTLKAQLIYYKGRAYLGAGRYAEALVEFQRIFDEYPQAGPPSELAAMQRANMIDRLNQKNPYQGILAYQEVVDRHPESKYAAPALFFMARLYNQEQNYDHAVDVYEEILEQYPDALVATKAQDSIAFIREYLWDGSPIARRSEPTVQLAQVCGPTALHHLLDLHQIQSSVEELAGLARTTEEGTSMMTLAQASREMGLPLAGVRADHPLNLPLPYLAFVNDNHYVLVTGEEGGVLTIQDLNRPPYRLAAAEFAKTWAGEALIPEARYEVAERLTDETMEILVGGESELEPAIGCGAAAIGGGQCADDDDAPEETQQPPCNPGGPTGGGGPGGGGGGCGGNLGGDLIDGDVGNGPGDGGENNGTGPGSGSCADPAGATQNGYAPSTSSGPFTPKRPASAGGSGGRGFQNSVIGGTWVLGGGGGNDAISLPMPVSRPGSGSGSESTPYKYNNAGIGVTAAGANALGINATIGAFTSGLRLDETDISIKTLGALSLTFSRNYENPKGIHREYYWNIGNFHNNIGNNWTHSLNIHIRVNDQTPDYSSFVLIDGSGLGKQFDRTFSDSIYDYYNYGLVTAKRTKSNGTFNIYFPNGFRYYFPDSNNMYTRIELIEDQSGNQLTFEYDHADPDVGKLTKVKTPAADGRYLQFDYSSGRITKASLKDSSNNTLKYVDYAYGFGLLATVKHDGETDGIVYGYIQPYPSENEKAIYISKITDREGNEYVIEFLYNTSNGPEAQNIRITYPDNTQTRWHRNISTNDLAIRNFDDADPRNVLAKTLWIPYSNNQVKQRDYYFDPDDTVPSATYKYNYNSTTFMLESLEVPGTTGAYITYEYDSDKRLTKIIHGDDDTTDPTYQFAYSSTAGSKSPTKITDPEGAETELFWDSSKRLTKIIAPQHGTSQGIRLFYNGTGHVTKVTNPLNKDTLLAYDAMGNVTKVTNALLDEVDLQYDKMNRVTKVIDPLDEETFIEYSEGGTCGACGTMGVITKVRRAHGSPVEYLETELEYDKNNNLTKVIDPEDNELDLFYDGRNRVTKVTYPSGAGGKSTNIYYDDLNRVSEVEDHELNSVTMAYDYMDRVTSIQDPVDTVALAYTNFGNITKVTDGQLNEWDFQYDARNRLTKVTDDITKIVKYEYDDASRITKVGAGSAGTVDPIEYFYNNAKAQLTKVRYEGNTSREATYEYDDAGRLTKLKDWIDGTNGISYAYDDIGRVTKVTDYDGEDLDYEYDDAGRVSKVTSYHGNKTGGVDTAYAYNDLHRLTKITAPGSKVWDFVYKDNGQVDFYDHPNGLRTDYTYDANDILTKIAHKDGAAELQSFTYAFDDVYNITKITHADGSYWDYEYDGRYRLTKAVRNNKPSPTISATWEYTYDDGDNLLTKVMPFEDNFDDGNLTGWTVSNTWDLSNYTAKNDVDPNTHSSFEISTTDADVDIAFEYANRDTSDNTFGLLVDTRWQDNNNRAQVRFRPDKVDIWERVSGTWSQLAAETGATTTQDVTYKARVEVDGSTLTVFRDDGAGGPAQEVLSATLTTTTTTRVRFLAIKGGQQEVDNVRILASDLDETVTYFYNAANELTKITDYNGDTTFNYDAWGRTTKKTRGTDYVDYAYRYGGFLHEVDATNWLGGDKVNYDYGGNGARRERTTDSGDYTWYNWAGFSVISEEDENATTRGDGDLAKSYFPGADVVGNDPSTAAYRYFTHDHLGSTRAVYDQNKNLDGDLEYTPYGDDFLIAAPTNATHRFTSHDWDTHADLYFAPFRYYSPDAARWMKRDPLGMIAGPNMYAYVVNDPVNYADPYGLFADKAVLAALIIALGGALISAQGVNAVNRANGQSFSLNQFLNPIRDAASGLLDGLRDLTNNAIQACKNFLPAEGDDRTVEDILKGKKGSIKDAALPEGSPGWDDILDLPWSDVVKKARANEPGFKTIKKLLGNKKFNK